jgi:hypothetical protein
MQAEAISDLDVIEDRRVRVVSFRGKDIEVKPITIGALPVFGRAIAPIVADLIGESGKDIDDVLAGVDLDRVLGWIDEHTDRLIDACAACSKYGRDWIADGDPAEFLELVSAVAAVNMDFFVHRLLPVAKRIVPDVKGQISSANGNGRTPSNF